MLIDQIHSVGMMSTVKALFGIFNQLSIRQKLLLVFVLIAGALGLFGVYLFTQLKLINQSFGTIDQRYSRLKNVLALEIDSKKLSNTVKSYLLTRDPKWQAAYNQTSINLDSSLQALNSNLNPAETQAIHDYQSVTDKLKGTELLILADVKEGSIDRARSLFDLTYEAQQAEAIQHITDLVSSESTTVSAVITQNRQQVTAIQGQLVLALILIVVIALLFFYFFAANITASIHTLAQAAVKFTGGDFAARVSLASRDEIGKLGDVFNDMAVKLQNSYAKLNDTLRQVVQRTNQLSEEKARFSSSIDSLPLGFIMTSSSNAILTINPAMQHMLGLKGATLTPDQLTDRLKDTAGLLEQLLEHSQDCLSQRKSINIGEIGEKGKIFRAFLSPVLLPGDIAAQAIGTAILVEDVTEERVMARSKDEFFSIASHELRTPLTAIRGNTSLIQGYYKDQLRDPQLNEMVGDIHESSIRLIEIVNDFLDASRLEQGKMQFNAENFALENVMESVVYELDAVTREKKIRLHMANNLDTLPHVWADKNKVKQIIYNLVGNAVKFVEDGSITLKAEAQAPFIKVYIIDTGKGISPENQQILFHKFQQAESSILTRDTTRGTGLGLYISKLLAEKMGGQVALEHSEVGKGSTFSFTVPIATDQLKNAKPPAPAPTPSATPPPPVPTTTKPKPATQAKTTKNS